MDDLYTRTPEDAALFQRHHHSADKGDTYRPSPKDLAEMAEDDAFNRRRRDERDDAARARGDYMAPPWLALAGSVTAMVLLHHGIRDATVTGVRHDDTDGYLRVDHPDTARVVEVLAAHDAVTETREGEGVVWARLPRTRDPWAAR